jgi:hypothetical protein
MAAAASMALLLTAHAAARPASPLPEATSSASLPDAPGKAAQPSGHEAPGSIHGVVLDPNGAVYPGARVTLTGPAGSYRRTTTTDASGHFNFADVPPGAFRLTVTVKGMRTPAVTGLLHAGESYAPQTIVLPLAAATTQVEVTTSEKEIETEQLHFEEKQRVLGVVPNFYVAYAPNAPPLTTKQKYVLEGKTAFDPITILGAGAAAGIEQANNAYGGYGQGAQGYFKRFGATYGTSLIGGLLGNAVLPQVFHQDPRYFYKGTGTIRSRALYAIAMSVLARGDNKRWEVNYSDILGGLAAGGISNLYLPAANRRGWATTFDGAGLSIGFGAAQNLLQEFVVRKLTPKVPNYAPAKTQP